MADLLNIGAQATELYRQALSTVSNNIANLNSDGYSRQEVRAEETIPTRTGVDYLGSGVDSKGVFRAFDEFPHWSNLTNQSWEEMYNEEFGWNQLEIDQDAFNNSIREWGTNTILLERVDF